MTEEHRHLKTGLLKTLWLLREYLSEIVIGGGWAPLIYYHYLLGDKSRFPILTRDIDILVKEEIPIKGSMTIDEILTEAGLESKLQSTGSALPVTRYEGKIDNYEVEIEFLTNLKGRGDRGVIEVQKGINAEALRFIAISVLNTQSVRIDDLQLAGISRNINVRVPTPAAFLFHKGLTFNRRREPQKKGKDLYYMFDVLVNFTGLEKQVDEELKELKSEFPKNWFKTFIANLDTFFADDSSEGVILVQSQRPHDSFGSMNDNQFRQYVFGIFTSLIEKLKSL